MLLGGHNHAVTQLEWSPDGLRLASASADGAVRVWERDRSDSLAVLKGGNGPVRAVSWSPGGARLVWESLQSSYLWNGSLNMQPIPIPAKSLQWNPEGDRLAASTGDKVRLWDSEDGQEVAALPGQTVSVGIPAWSPDGTRLASTDGSTVRIWFRGIESARPFWKRSRAQEVSQSAESWIPALLEGLESLVRPKQQ